MLKAVFIWLLFFCAGNSFAQGSFPLEKRFEGGISDFAVDNLGSIYLFYKTDQLKKLDANGDSVGVFNAVRKYGQLYSIDVTNPLKILLYYKDFGTIVTLDRFLNVRNTIDLRRLNIFQAKAVGLSFDNNVWRTTVRSFQFSRRTRFFNAP